MSLGISPGRYRRGEFVYTCECGREGELEWMHEHLRLAHGLKGAREREEMLRTLPKRREYVNIREVGGESTSDSDGEVTAPEDELSPVPYEMIQLLVDFDQSVQSKLTGKDYLPALKGQVVRVPKDLADLLTERGDARKTTLTPEDVERVLFPIWESVLAGTSLARRPEEFRRQFFKEIDGSQSLDANKNIVLFEARRVFSLFAPVPPRAEILPPAVRTPAEARERFPAEAGAPTISMQQVEGRSPMDGKPMERRRTFEFEGLVYKVKDDVELWEEKPPTFTVGPSGERVLRTPKLYLWDKDTGTHIETSLRDLADRRLATPLEVARAETVAAMAYKDYLNGVPEEEIMRTYDLKKKRLDQIIKKGREQGVGSLFGEVD